MPRVSEAHREARREQILAAARRCFARNGFHATSMQDVITESGLSVGAVYRYFPGKHALRTTVAEENMGALLDGMAAIAAHQPPLPLAEAMARVVDLVEPQLAAPGGPIRIGVQAWGEALRDPELGRFVAGKLRAVRATFVAIARQAQRAGDLPSDADVAGVGAALMALMPGYLLQRLLTGEPDRDTFVTALRTLLPS